MSRLTRIGIWGLGILTFITAIVVLSGGRVIYTAPFAIPFSVMILIGISNGKPRT